MDFGHGGTMMEPSRGFFEALGEKFARLRGPPSASRQSHLGLFLSPKSNLQLPQFAQVLEIISRTLLRREIEPPGRRGRKSTPSAIC